MPAEPRGQQYRYRGDRWTDPQLRGQVCERVPGAPWFRGKTVVRFVDSGRVCVVLCGNGRLVKAPA